MVSEITSSGSKFPQKQGFLPILQLLKKIVQRILGQNKKFWPKIHLLGSKKIILKEHLVNLAPACCVKWSIKLQFNAGATVVQRGLMSKDLLYLLSIEFLDRNSNCYFFWKICTTNINNFCSNLFICLHMWQSPIRIDLKFCVSKGRQRL